MGARKAALKRPLAVLLLMGMGLQPLPAIEALADSRLSVFVSIAPQAYFLEKIGGERVDVNVMVRPGANPATYEPRPAQMAALSKSPVYFAVGVPFEDIWLKKIAASNPDMLIVRTDSGIRKVEMVGHHHEDRTPHVTGAGNGRSGIESDQHRGSPDPHIWLSPPLVKIQAGHILQALTQIDPVHRSDYRRNYRQFVRELDTLHGRLQTIFSDKAGQAFMVFHPSWGYFSRTYGLRQIPIEIEGKNPKPAQLKTLIDRAAADNIKIIFAQPQFSAKSARLIAREIGGQVVFADPLSPDWENNLQNVAVKFNAALR